eukprot:gene1564-biopygen26588
MGRDDVLVARRRPLRHPAGHPCTPATWVAPSLVVRRCGAPMPPPCSRFAARDVVGTPLRCHCTAIHGLVRRQLCPGLPGGCAFCCSRQRSWGRCRALPPPTPAPPPVVADQEHRLVAYLENWNACPPDSKIAKYSKGPGRVCRVREHKKVFPSPQFTNHPL